MKIKFSKVALLASILAYSVGIGAIAYFSINLLEENKRKDSWAINFLSLKDESEEIAERFEIVTRRDYIEDDKSSPLNFDSLKDRFKQEPELSLLQVGSRYQILYSRNASPSSEDLKLLISQGGEIEDFLYKSEGQDLLAKYFSQSDTSRIIVVWKFDLSSLIDYEVFEKINSLIYLVNRSGQVLYSNRNYINDNSVVNRPLVQKYIDFPLKTGQLSFENGSIPFDGFFSYIDLLNTSLFVEIPSTNIAFQVSRLARFIGLIALVVICLAVIVVYVFFGGFSSSVGSWIEGLVQIGSANFHHRLPSSKVVEYDLVAQAYNHVSLALLDRDKKIASYIEKFGQSQRVLGKRDVLELNLSNELADGIIDYKFIKVQVKRMVRDDNKSDWYDFLFDEERAVAGLVLVDYSNKNTSEIILASLMKKIFQDIAREGFVHFDQLPYKFNDLLLASADDVMAKAVFVRWDFLKKEVTIHNSGYMPPLTYCIKTNEFEWIPMKSSPLGISSDLKVAIKNLSCEKQGLIFLSNGFFEALQSSSLGLSNKALLESFRSLSSYSFEVISSHIDKNLYQSIEKAKLLDDAIIIHCKT